MCISYERAVVEVHQALLSRLPLPEVLDETLHATHGIENMLTPSIMKKRKESRMTPWSVVLLEQEKQNEFGEYNPFKIAAASRRHSEWSVARAKKVGKYQSNSSHFRACQASSALYDYCKMFDM